LILTPLAERKAVTTITPVGGNSRKERKPQPTPKPSPKEQDVFGKAPKERKNAAHGASRGSAKLLQQAPKGRKKQAIHHTQRRHNAGAARTTLLNFCTLEKIVALFVIHLL
jgi:hypothetical protein